MEHIDRPLEGLRVLDITWAAAGPSATSFLAFLGADVVKVETSARPDLLRVADRQYGRENSLDINQSPVFNEIAAGKRSIELDLKSERDLETALRLAAVCDVFVENMRPGKIEKLHMDYQSLSKSNPTLVMCSVSATGRPADGAPPGYAPVFWAEGGGAWMTGWPDRTPGAVRGVVDLHTGGFACLGILALLRQRALTGRGGYIDCSAIEAVTAAIGVHLLDVQAGSNEPTRAGNSVPWFLVNEVVPCEGDDEWLAITLDGDPDVERFIDVMHATFGVEISRDDLLANPAETLAAVTCTRRASDLELALLDADLAAARSSSMLHALGDPRLTARAALQEVNGQHVVGLPWLANGHPYPIPRPAPDLGADGPDILRDWLEPTAYVADLHV